MKNKGILIRSTLLILLWIVFIFIATSDGFNFGWVVILIILIITGFVYFIYTVIQDIRLFKKTKTLISFTSTVVGIIIILSSNSIINKLDAPNSSPVIFQAIYESGGVSHCWIIFRKDNSYEYFNGSPLGGDEIKGKYTLSNNLIVLDKSNFDNALRSGHLFIDSQVNLGNTKKLIQLNKNGAVIDSAIEFNITMYNK